MPTYRIIHSLYFDLGRQPEGQPGSSTALCVRLDRHGMPSGPGGNGNGRPRPPKSRTIDLRPGDEILCSGRWCKIVSVTAHRAHWLTEAQALAHEGDCGYVYRVAERPTAESVVRRPPNPDGIRHQGPPPTL
jgi:hypothetical protein